MGCRGKEDDREKRQVEQAQKPVAIARRHAVENAPSSRVRVTAANGGMQELKVKGSPGIAAERFSRVPSMFDSLGVEVPYPT